MRTRAQHKARYNGLSPRQFAERIGTSEEHVRGLIRDGWFVWVDGIPECQDVRRVGAGRPEYRIEAGAVDRWFRERAVTERAA